MWSREKREKNFRDKSFSFQVRKKFRKKKFFVASLLILMRTGKMSKSLGCSMLSPSSHQWRTTLRLAELSMASLNGNDFLYSPLSFTLVPFKIQFGKVFGILCVKWVLGHGSQPSCLNHHFLMEFATGWWLDVSEMQLTANSQPFTLSTCWNFLVS